jgi:hypothetical protein
MNTTQNNGGPAFPIPTLEREYWDREQGEPNGMTLRDWYAGMALQGSIEWNRLKGKESIHEDGYDQPQDQPCMPSYWEDSDCKEIAECCYAIADAMLAARKEGK